MEPSFGPGERTAPSAVPRRGTRLALLGAGRTASTLARALLERGYVVAALTTRTLSSAAAASEHLEGAAVVATNAEAAVAGDLVLLGVPDEALEPLVAELVLAGADLRGRVVLHLSGALDSSLLEPLRARGAAVGSMHPLQTFPERIAVPGYLAGTTFAIEGDVRAVTAAGEVAAALGARRLVLEAGTKPLYHAAASLAANGATVLLDAALRLLARAGVTDPRTGMQALLPLLVTTLSAIEARGPASALTGPVARGDAATLRAHLDGLSAPDLPLYTAVARGGRDLARRAGRLGAAAASRVEGALAERPLVVVASVAAADGAGLVARKERAAGADLVEFRLDLLDDPAAAPLDSLAGPATIVTCRPSPKLDARGSRALVERALAAGARYVDVELGREEGLPLDRLVLSFHGPAGEALAAANAIARSRPAVGKVAIELEDVTGLALLPELARVLRRGAQEVAVLALGHLGAASRPLARRLGSDWTYAGLPGEPTASGQHSLPELLGLYRARLVGRGTRVFGLAGSPLGHSLSPVYMNRLLPEILGDAAYVPFETRDAAALLRLARSLPVAGLSVTMPLKEAVFGLVDERSPEAEATGSVNTVLQAGGLLYGANTDAGGIAEVAAGLLRLEGARALVLGSGGSARSAAWALARAGAAVTIVGRTQAKARAAAEALCVAWAARPEGVPGWDLLVNATPVGLEAGAAAGALPLSASAFERGGVAVVDLVYAGLDPRDAGSRRHDTALVRAARARGLRVAGGLDVLLAQGREQLRLFTGVEVSRERLLEAVR